MLSWLFPRPPIDTLEKAWTETRMQGLAEHLGAQKLLSAHVLLPDRDLFSSTYEGTAAEVELILARMCEHLNLPPQQHRVEVQAAQCGGDSAEAAAAQVLKIEEKILPNPYAVAAAVARQLAGRQLPEQLVKHRPAHEVAWLADLAGVYLGLGALAAHPLVGDSPEDRAGSCGCGPAAGPGQLPARMMGYALALFALARNEKYPDWKGELRLDALASFNRAMSYLRRTGDSLFTAESIARPPGERATEELLEQLVTGSRSARVAALWELRRGDHAALAVEPVVRCLHDRLPVIRQEAAKTVAHFGPAAHSALPGLLELLEDGSPAIRAASATALGAVAADSPEALEQLTQRLRDADRSVVASSAVAVRAFGQQGENAIPAILAALRGAVIRCDHSLIDTLTNTLYGLDPDPTDRVLEYFEQDPELREQVVHVIVDALGDRHDGHVA